MKRKNKPKKGREIANRLVRAVLLLVLCTLFACTERPPKPEVGSSCIEKLPVDTAVFEPSKTATELQFDSMGLLEIKEHAPAIRVDLKYATTDNFTGKILYQNLNKAYLHPFALSKLMKAQALLCASYPHYRLLVYDAARPLHVQQGMYDAVRHTPYRLYVAPPERTGLHNYGLAVDITICDEQAHPLDMGTTFDYFGAKASINNEQALVAAGSLTQLQVDNRKLLRNLMREAGFIPIRGEWWHFNACSLAEAKKIAKVIE